MSYHLNMSNTALARVLTGVSQQDVLHVLIHQYVTRGENCLSELFCLSKDDVLALLIKSEHVTCLQSTEYTSHFLVSLPASSHDAPSIIGP